MPAQHSPAQALAFRFDGTFALADARLLVAAMRAAPADSEVYVDFSRVHDFSDSAVAVLSQALCELDTRASVRGLRQHQYRLLQYLGVPNSALDRVH